MTANFGIYDGTQRTPVRPQGLGSNPSRSAFLRSDGVWSQIGSGVAGMYPVGTSRFFGPANALGFALSPAGQQAQRLCLHPVVLNRPATVSDLSTYCSTSEAGSTLRLGLYGMDDNLRPTTLIADYGTVSGASTGGKTATGTTVVDGPFMLAVWASNHTTVRWSRYSVIRELYGESSVGYGRTNYFLTATSVDYSNGFPQRLPTLSVGETVGVNPDLAALMRFT